MLDHPLSSAFLSNLPIRHFNILSRGLSEVSRHHLNIISISSGGGREV